jgi:hypothetical protein
MKFRFGCVPENPEFDPEADCWRPLKEPTAGWAQFLALPVGIGTALLLVLLWHTITPFRPFEFPTPLTLLLIFAASIPIHELIHFFTFPKPGRDSHAMLGFWPAKLAFYAHYEGELSRNRFVMVLVNPFLVLSLLPLLFCAVFRCFVPVLMLLSLVNTLSSSVDLLGCQFVLWQVPASATVRNRGWKTYYKLCDGIQEDCNERAEIERS